MAHSEIPADVRGLIARHIESVQQVEILALLRSDPEREWTAQAISRSLHIAADACDRWLRAFAAAHLVVGNDAGFRHAGQRDVDQLLEFYSRRRLAVIDAVYNKPGAFAD